MVDGNPCVPRKAGYCVPSLGCGGVPLDDTTVEQSQEHLIVTRWRTSGRPAHAGNALLTDFVYTQAGREIVAHIVTSVCCGAFNQKIFAIWWKNTFQLSSVPVGPLSNTFGKTVQF